MATGMEVPTLGGIVLVDERKPDVSYRLLEERAKLGNHVLCITREPPERAVRRHRIENAEHYWLITRGTANAVNPFDLEGLRVLIERFLREHRHAVVFLDGVELLMVMNTYEEVRDLLLGLRTAIGDDGAGCVIPIDTRTLTARELGELKASFPMVRNAAPS